MFTGIITATAQVNYSKQLKGGMQVKFAKPRGWDDLILGESIAVNGACLTVAAMEKEQWEAFLMPETLEKTSFGQGMPEAVNLERAVMASDRLSGHIVQGHVDGVGVISDITESDEYSITVEFPADNSAFVVYKGSITINGVSLTIASVSENKLTVALIPHTLEHTTLGSLKVGDSVNLEFDMIGKYIVNFMENIEIKQGNKEK